MPIFVPSSPVQGITTTVQDILDDVSKDLRKQISNTGTESLILLEYVDRIHGEILRRTNWKFLLSDIKSFPTVLGTSSYYVGTGSTPAGTTNTSLNLNDIRKIKEDSVNDMTNYKNIVRIADPPMDATFYQNGYPKLYRNSQASPYTISLWPFPNGVYTINFQYYQTVIELTDPTQVIQIPDIYEDVIIAGTNFYGYAYLKMEEDSAFWKARFEDGIRAIQNDMNHWPKSNDFIRGDRL